MYGWRICVLVSTTRRQRPFRTHQRCSRDVGRSQSSAPGKQTAGNALYCLPPRCTACLRGTAHCWPGVLCITTRISICTRRLWCASVCVWSRNAQRSWRRRGCTPALPGAHVRSAVAAERPQIFLFRAPEMQHLMMQRLRVAASGVMVYCAAPCSGACAAVNGR